MEWRAPALPRGLDDPDRPQAVGGPLGDQHIAAEHGGQFPCAERARWKRWQDRHNVLQSPQFHAIDDVHEAALAWISCPTTRPSGPTAANVILAKQQHLHGQMRVRQKRRERNKLVEHLDHAAPPWGAANRRDLTMLVDADDATFGCYGIHDSKPMLIEQRIELWPERREAPRLDLDQFAIRPDQVDHETTDWHLEPVPGARQHRLDRSMQRTLAQHTDVRHGDSVCVNPADFEVGRRRMLGHVGQVG